MATKYAPSNDNLELDWDGDERHPLDEAHSQWEVRLKTSRGEIDTRFHPAEKNGNIVTAGVVYVGGAHGGLDGPARGLYRALCDRLQPMGIAGLRLHYRHPNYLSECVLDTMVGAAFLVSEGVQRVALVGHSFGGAVVISAGALLGDVVAVVALSTQTTGTQLTRHVSPRQMLLVHGEDDDVLPHTCTKQVFEKAREPKDMIIYPGVGHDLHECRDELLELLVKWLPEKLGAVERGHND